MTIPIRATTTKYLLLLVTCWTVADGFVTSPRPSTVGKLVPSVTALFSTTEEEKQTKEPTISEAVNGDQQQGLAQPNPDSEGLPWWWEFVWKLGIMQKGEPGTPMEFGDTANVIRTNIEQIYGGYPSLDGCPLAGRNL
jgi:hypothetical protein